jgi:hypothetical protein
MPPPRLCRKSARGIKRCRSWKEKVEWRTPPAKAWYLTLEGNRAEKERVNHGNHAEKERVNHGNHAEIKETNTN